jgi:hypothetical protein
MVRRIFMRSDEITPVHDDIKARVTQQWFQPQPPRKFFVGRIHQLVPEGGVCLNTHRDYFYQPLFLHAE